MTTPELEYRIAKFLNPRINLIVPNVSWGLNLPYECDLLCVSPAGYATEIELKISRSDIKADLGKRHKHDYKLIRRFFYGVPWELRDCEYLPKDCGIIAVKDDECYGSEKIIRPPRLNKFSRRITNDERLTLLRLGCMRIWGLKQKIYRMSKKAGQPAEPGEG